MSAERKLLVPEVIQTSGMDCGPAALQALLAGHGIPIDYARLREACQTDIDGTSIDTLEDVACGLGLDAEQYIVPVDHLLMEEAEALPAIVITRLPSGIAHFVVVWRQDLGLLQIMDPSTGRTFRRPSSFTQELLVHHFPASVELAGDWLRAPAFLGPLRRRLQELGLTRAQLELRLGAAEDGGSGDWFELASLDAAARLAQRLVDAGALAAGDAAALVVELCAETKRRGAAEATRVIPLDDWSARLVDEHTVMLRGAVLVHAAGRSEELDLGSALDAGGPSPELGALLEPSPFSPARALLESLRELSPGPLAVLALALLLAGLATTMEAALLGSLTSLSSPGGAHEVGLAPGEIIARIGMFLAAAAALELSITSVLARLGRDLEFDLRTRLLLKLPRLGSHYFHSRLRSDLAHRAHELGALRQTPTQLGAALRSAAELLVTVVGLVLLVPERAGLVIAAGLVLLLLPFAALPLMREQDLRCQTHTSALLRMQLDALLGALPVRAHRGERAVRVAYEELAAKWLESARALGWTGIAVVACEFAIGVALALALVSPAGVDTGLTERALLAVYWSLGLPVLAQTLFGLLQQLPGQRNRAARAYEVLRGREEHELLGEGAPLPDARAPGVRVELQEVSVVAGGTSLLSEVDLQLAPGEHVAIVGPSGAGKTSLVGLLLGWHRPSAGQLRLDGARAGAETIRALRRVTAWVDPAVSLWKRGLADNLRYGNESGASPLGEASLREAVDAAELGEVLRKLPMGMDTGLGEGGSLLSGGEGQRVRFARALLRRGVRLCVLDEPFRGLELERRVALLACARERWRDATLLYVSHDIDAALGFDRVLVVEGGRLVEDGAPAALLAEPGSRLAALAGAQRAAAAEVWGASSWRRWWFEDGQLRERPEAEQT